MLNETKIRNYIRKVLLEEVEVTVRPGRGGYKKQIRDAGALAKENPAELMKRLGISRTSEDSDIKKLNDVMTQAVEGESAMKGVYGLPMPRKDNSTGLEGVRIPVKLIPPRDARKYLEHTIIGVQGSQFATFDREVQVEILGSDILMYFADRPYSWGRASMGKKKKDEPATQEESDTMKKELIGEPDLNPDRDSEIKKKKDDKDEASGSAMVSGPITPLGTGPTYPDKPQRKPQSAAEITGRAFGNAKPVKKKKKKN